MSLPVSRIASPSRRADESALVPGGLTTQSWMESIASPMLYFSLAERDLFDALALWISHPRGSRTLADHRGS
ncbi:hypothetical protein AURDEDRAFT_117932 [Auricularia subglabra TFB-10046 SS5]|uniref:Uncharacterized protein n=1 Tax=Auricularia subglabra (strain TFB-10046 / SS5) TaxID=717982 RepID=J0WLB0_AURST|nr:hypothetical protein AURDEDRAFT_117932 [Auricularia subglabra TFB-10046 SS5]